jgi:hypothetical protein
LYPSQCGEAVGSEITVSKIADLKPTPNLEADMKCKALILAVLAACVFILPDARGEPPANNDAIALIEFENVPLPEVIRNLARQARLNILLDPKVTAPPFSGQMVSVRWQGVTAKEALLAVLENYGLVLVEM